MNERRALVCPECAAGKCRVCSDLAVNDADVLVGCECAHDGSGS